MSASRSWPRRSSTSRPHGRPASTRATRSPIRLLTDNQNGVQFGGNAFATIQDAITNYGTSTSIIVNPGDYTGTTTLSQPVTIQLQGGAVSIESLVGNASASDTANLITIPSGTSLTVDGSSTGLTTYIGTITGAGAFVKAGSGSLTLTQASNFTGTVQVSGGTLQLGNGSAVASAGSGAITVNATATLAYDELGSATAPATIANAIGGLGNLTVLGTTSNGALVFTGANSYSGILTVAGGRFVPATVGAIGNPSAVVINNGGQFSFGTLTGVNMTAPLSLSTTGFTDANGVTGGLLFTGTTNTWSGQISVTGTGRIGAFGATANLPGAITGTGTVAFGAGTTTAETFRVTGNSNNVANASVNLGATAIIGSAATLGSLSNNININGSTTNQGTVAFNSSTPDTFTGSITGGGALAIQGGGNMTFGSGASVLLGTNTNSSSGLFIGDNIGAASGAGTLNILSGTVTDAAALYVGATSPGTVNQSGGSVSLTSTTGNGNNTNLIIEKGAGLTATSTYNLTGGTLTSTTSEITVGGDGIGVLNISGASTVTTLLGIRESSTTASTSGTVTATSGTLKLGSSGIYAGTTAGTQIFSIGAATLQATANDVISVPTSITGVIQADSQSFTYGLTGAISGAGSINKIGTGNLTLAGNSSFSGGTTINVGSVTSTTSTSLGTGVVDEVGGTLNVQGSSPYTNPVIVPAGSTATTNVIASSANVVMGPLSIGTGATLNVTGSTPVLTGFGGNGTGWTANGGATAASDVLTLTDGGGSEARSFWYDTQVPVTSFQTSYIYQDVGGTLSNNADGSAFVLQSSGTNALGNTGGALGYGGIANPSFAVEFNIYTGGGQPIGFQFATNGTTGTYLAIASANGTVTGNPINLISGTPVHVDLNYNGTVLTMTLTDNSGDKFVATDTVNLATVLGSTTAFMGFTGGTGGTVSTQKISNFVNTAGATVPSSYGLIFAGANIAGTDTINVANAAFGPGTLSLGAVSDGGVPATLNLNPTGTGIVSLPSPAGGIVSGTAVNLEGGTLNLGFTAALGNLAAVNVSSGASIVLGASETFGSLSGAGNVTLNGNILADGSTNNLSSTFAGTIADGTPTGGGLTKAGTGSLTLTGSETYTGPTTVSAGSLILGSTGSLSPSSTVSVVGTGVLGGTGTVGSVINSGIVNPGVPGTPGTLNVAGNLTLGTGTLVLDLPNSTTYDSVNASGPSTTVSGATLSLITGTISSGSTFTILASSTPIVGTFVNLPDTTPNSTITVGSVTFSINYHGGTSGDNIVLTAMGSSSPSIVSTVLNGGLSYINNTAVSQQHSMVENIVYSFSQAVSLSTTNFALTGINGTPNGPTVALTPSSGNTVWTVTFTGTGVNTATNSIGDGEYDLALTGVPGLTNSSYDFFRLLGDMDGNGTVDSSDFNILISSFLRGTADPAYLGADDLDGNNKVDGSDFNIFVSNFLKKLPDTTLLH